MESPARPSVLVVEDDRAVRDSLERALRVVGYDVEVAADGAAGLAAVHDRHPDVAERARRRLGRPVEVTVEPATVWAVGPSWASSSRWSSTERRPGSRPVRPLWGVRHGSGDSDADAVGSGPPFHR